LNYLVAARASFRLGDNEGMRRYLGEAERVESGAHIALELTQAELQLNAGKNEQALATLVRARDNASRHPYVLELLATAYTRLQDWAALRDLLPDLRKAAVVEGDRLLELERATWSGLLHQAGNAEEPVDAMIKLWSRIPKHLTQESAALRYAYVDGLIAHGASDKAEKVITSELDRAWDMQLAARLGQLRAARPERLLKLVRRYLEQQGRDSALLLAAARIALQANDEAQAVSWLEEAHKQSPSPVLCMELARLREAKGEVKAARRLVEEAAQLAVGPLPDWREPATGAVSAARAG
jgi:HemY protein